MTDKPAISHLERKNEDGRHDRLASATEEWDTIEDTKTGSYVVLIASTAALGGLLFGYDTGVISGVLLMIKDDLGSVLTANNKELITSLTSGGAFFGAIIAGLIADRWDRKPAISFGAVIFVLGAVIQAVSFSVAQMAVGRAVIGLGVGVGAMVVPIYISEVAPSKLRGRLITLQELCITGAQFLSSVLNYGFQHVAHGWR